MITINNFNHIDYGRFGNQLFQYALAKVLSLYHGCEFYLKPSEHFLKFFDNNKLTYQEIKDNNKQYNYIEKDPYAFDSNIFKINNIDLLGFFQNLSYYTNYLEEICKELSPNNNIIKNTYNYMKTKTKYNLNIDKSIGIHVRRTDYTQLQNKHGFLDAKYYHNIIEENNLNDYSIFIVSDDIKVVESEFTNLFDRYDTYYIDDLDVYHDFYIMYLTRVNLISNSTFSWWSATLSDTNAKTIYAPFPWINCSEAANTMVPPKNINLYPHSWHKIDYSISNWDKLFV